MQRRLLPDRHGGQVRATFDLVAPLADEATEKRIGDNAGITRRVRSRAVTPMIGTSLRQDDVNSANLHSTRPTATMPGTRTSTTATRTIGTRTTSSGPVQSADENHRDIHAEPSFEDLVTAYLDCRKRKRNTNSALAFELDRERNLARLYDELLDGTYRPGTSICFVITRPKPREVWAADFRDRIVHHLLYNRISPRFYRSFLPDSCACIPGRGTLYAARRLEAKIRGATQNWSRSAYYLKMDLANFFVSIDKPILGDLLARRVFEPWWIRLTETVLFHDPRANYVLQGSPERLALIPPHKSLFNHGLDKGLPIGNLSSQFFANVYLDVLDQFVKHRIGARHYIRYVDDFILLHDSPDWLNLARGSIEELLESKLLLRLNPRKTVLQPIARGVDFVGQVIRPWHRTIRRRVVNNALHQTLRVGDDRLFDVMNSYFGLFRQASHNRGDRVKLARAALLRGHCVDLELTKIYHKRTTR